MPLLYAMLTVYVVFVVVALLLLIVPMFGYKHRLKREITYAGTSPRDATLVYVITSIIISLTWFLHVGKFMKLYIK